MIITGIGDESGKSLQAQIKAHKELGWDAIELRLVDGVNVSTTQFPDDKFEEVVETLAANNMKVAGFASAIGNWSRPINGDFSIDVEDLKVAAKRMNRLGTKYIRVMSWVEKDLPEPELRKEVIRRLKELTKIAESEGIYIAHENCTGWGGHSANHMLELKEEINSPNFVLLYDIGNVVSYGYDPMDFFKVIRGHFAYIHVKDAIAVPGQHSDKFRYCGEGDAKVKEILETVIKEDGYDGVISIEPHIAAIVHSGEGREKTDEELSQSYITYGRKLQGILDEILK
jgi:sugar phosphate isomerase/epimerase